MQSMFGQLMHERIEMMPLHGHKDSRPDGHYLVTILLNVDFHLQEARVGQKIDGAIDREPDHRTTGLFNDLLTLDFQFGFPSGSGIACLHIWLSVGAGRVLLPNRPQPWLLRGGWL